MGPETIPSPEHLFCSGSQGTGAHYVDRRHRPREWSTWSKTQIAGFVQTTSSRLHLAVGATFSSSVSCKRGIHPTKSAPPIQLYTDLALTMVVKPIHPSKLLAINLFTFLNHPISSVQLSVFSGA